MDFTPNDLFMSTEDSESTSWIDALYFSDLALPVENLLSKNVKSEPLSIPGEEGSVHSLESDTQSHSSQPSTQKLKRKISHRSIEKKRRVRMKTAFDRLKELTKCDKPDKVSILNAAIEEIENLRKHI